MPRSENEFWPSWSWHALAVIGLADCLWLALSPVSLDAKSWITIAALIGVAGANHYVIRRWPVSDRARMLALGIGFMLVAWPALRVLNHLTMTTALPLADPMLVVWDRQLGLDWLAYVRWADNYPLLLRWMDLTYQGLTLYSLATFPILLLCFGTERAREFVLIFFVTAVSATLIGMLFPAGNGLPAAGPCAIPAHHAGVRHLSSGRDGGAAQRTTAYAFAAGIARSRYISVVSYRDGCRRNLLLPRQVTGFRGGADRKRLDDRGNARFRQLLS